MTVIGLISCFEESARIGRAVESLFAAGCRRVVCVDGAWIVDGVLFGGASERWSTDGTLAEAKAAGAETVRPTQRFGTDGEKRNVAIHLAGAIEGDHLFLLDADEELTGRLPEDPPYGHATVMLRNLAPNDMPDIRGTFPSGDYSNRPIPLLRWLRWSPELRCTAPGAYWEDTHRIEPYLVNTLRQPAEHSHLMNLAYAALHSVEALLPAKHLSILPILDGVEIQHHGNPGKTDAKRAYYEALA